MNLTSGPIKGYYEIGLTYINHRIKIRVFNGEIFNDLLTRIFFILGLDRENRLYALKQEDNSQLICDNDELIPETFYQLVVVDKEKDKPLVSPFQSEIEKGKWKKQEAQNQKWD